MLFLGRHISLHNKSETQMRTRRNSSVVLDRISSNFAKAKGLVCESERERGETYIVVTSNVRRRRRRRSADLW